MKNITILGASGTIGGTLRKELQAQQDSYLIKLVAQNKINGLKANEQTFQANLLNQDEAISALEDSNLVFSCIGLPYETKIWEQQWPVITENLLKAAKVNQSKIIFFENVYALGKVDGEMREESRLKPNSKKGEVKKRVQELITDSDDVDWVIARSADFYGPGATSTSLLFNMNIENLLKGKTPSFVISPQKLHTFTYIPDAAKALVELGESKVSNKNIWHLPSSSAITGDEFMEIINREFARENTYKHVGKNMFRFFSLFNKGAREMLEMFYQFENDYIFNSDKFQKHFKTKPTPYTEGIKDTVTWCKENA